MGVSGKIRTLGELAKELRFNNEDYIDIVIDRVCENYSHVSSVYSSLGMNPNKSYLTNAIRKKSEAVKQENILTRLYRRLSHLFSKPSPKKMDWQKCTQVLPSCVRRPDDYMDYKVPISLIDIASRKLSPLEEQLNNDKEVLARSIGHLDKGARGWINKNIRAPVIGILYFLTYGRITVMAEEDAKKESALKELDMTYLEVSRELKMEFTDILMVQYFEKFDKESMTFKTRIGDMIDFAELYSSLGDTPEEIKENMRSIW